MRTLVKAILICLLLFVAFAVVMAIHNDTTSGNTSSNSAKSDGSEQAQRTSETRAEQAQRVSALKLFADYQRNEVAADNVYKGHLLAVTGMVTSINKDMFDKVYVTLASYNEFMNVQAHLDDGSASRAATLERGQVVTVICTGSGMIVGSPMLQDCSFAKARDEMLTATAKSETQTPTATVPQDQPDTKDTDPASPDSQSDGPEKVGGGVSAPVVISSVDPEVPAAAVQAKMGATVLVHLIVDRNGLPIDVQAVNTVYIDHDGHASSGPNSTGNNLGFSENAVDSVKRYRFKPAMKNGMPVPVELNVNVNYRTP